MKKIVSLLIAVFSFAYASMAQEGLASYTVTRNTAITYTSIAGTGSSANFWRNIGSVSTDDNLSEAIPIGFNFLYDGTNIGYVQMSTNGFMTLLTNSGAVGSGTGTTPYSFTNTVFTLPNGTVRTLAPFYDDLQTAGNLGTLADLSASMKYQLTGSAPNRVFTVEWINMQDFATSSTASLNYQVQLFEGSNNIRFGYGTMTPGAATWTYTLGINSRTLTATPTLSQLLTQQTDNTNTFSATASNALATIPASNTEIIFTSAAAAPVPMSGTYTVPGSFATMTALINALNYNGTNGAVTVNVNAGSTFTEDLPPLQTGTFADVITIQKSGAGANPVIRPTWTAAGTADYGFRMFGVDNLVWDGIDIASNGSNVEFGLFLSQLSDKNGCQNNTFRNFNITLSRTGTVGQVGILMNSAAQAALAASGANAGNVFKNFAIRNVAGGGIQFNGALSALYNIVSQPSFVMDNNNQVTNDVCSNFNIIGDPLTPNDMIPVTTAVLYGIFNLGQKDMTISNCSISNLSTSSTGAINGIIPNGTSSAQMPANTFSQGVLRISNNKILTLRATNASAGIVSGIRMNVNGNAGTAARIYNNFIGDLSSTSTVTTSRRIVGIQMQDGGTGAGAAIEVWHNSVSLTPAGIACSNSCIESYTSTTGPVFTVRNNIFANFTAAQATAKHYCIVSSSATVFGNAGTVSNNNDLYHAGTTNGFNGLGSTTDFATIANWTAANTQDAASITVNPAFSSATDLHISALALNNTAPSAPAYITNDIDCEVRPLPAATNFDLGADEIDVCSGTPTGAIAGTTSVCSGTGTILTLTGASAGAGISHSWASATVSGGPYSAPIGTGTTQATGNLTVTTYYVDTIRCSISGLLFVTPEFTVAINPKPTVPVTPSGTVNICAPGTQTLDASGTNAASPAFQWIKNGVALGGEINPTYVASTPGTYRVRVQNGVTGCFDTSAVVTVTVNITPAAVTITPSSASICIGSNVGLTAGGGTVGSSGNATLGTGVTLTGATTQPTAFCNRFAQYWNQTIYTAAELSAAGLTGGTNITSVTYTTTSQGDAANNTNFSIRIGNTGSSTLSAFQTTGLSTVYGPATYVHAIGTNTITFTTPFTWDGFSNIILDVRQDGVDMTNNAITFFTAAADNKNIEAHTSTTSGVTPLQTLVANASVIPTASTTRLNIVLGMAAQNPSWLWTPATGLNVTNVASVTASPTITTTYTAKATVNGCDNSNTVMVTVTGTTGATTLAGTATPGGSPVCNTYVVNPGATDYMNSCNLIATVTPGTVSGSITSCVTVDTGATKLGTASLYLARNMDITPATAPGSSSATVKLYFLQSEFDNYNTRAVDSGFAPLPTGPGDLAHIDSLILRQFHGNQITRNPLSYSGASQDFTTATGLTVAWNGTNNWWEVTVPVGAFSGFFVASKARAPLPVTIEYFRGTKQGGNHLLDWKVSCTNTPSATLVLERSSDARSFGMIYSIHATAVRCLQPFSYVDATPMAGINYYRLKMIDADGKISYSSIVALTSAKKGFEFINITPNPVTEGKFKLNITSAEQLKMTLNITDVTGRVVAQKDIAIIAGFNAIDMNVNNLAAGTYQLFGNTADGRTKVLQFVKQ